MYRYREAKKRSGAFAQFTVAMAKINHIFWNLATSSDINRNADIHPSVRLPHPIGLVIHEDAVVGENCMIMQQVTLGQMSGAGAPVLGKKVYVGAGAKILGAVTIGDNARIGANAVVLTDVPADATAVGVPARVTRRDAEEMKIESADNDHV